MAYLKEDWEAAARQLEKGGQIENIRFKDIKQFKELNPAEAVFLLRNLLRDFGVKDECVIASCEEARRMGRVEWALFEQLETLGGSDISYTIPGVFNRALSWCRGIRTDWKYGDDQIERLINRDLVLGKYGLKVSFSPHVWPESFEISLMDTNSCTLIDKVEFKFNDEHDMHGLIESINEMILKKGLEFLDADEGGDSYEFVLFETAEIARLGKKYGDVRELVNLHKVLNYLYSIPEPRDPDAEREFEELKKELEALAEKLRRALK